MRILASVVAMVTVLGARAAGWSGLDRLTEMAGRWSDSRPRVATAPPTVAVLAAPAKLTFPGGKPGLPWPASGQAQVQVAGIGMIGHSGGSDPVPIASVTKVMTAYLILRHHPIPAGQEGPTIVITAAEAAAYPQQKARGESLVRVAAGERITERQALEGLMLASGDNMAEILARWDAGSGSSFVRAMNTAATDLGLTSTHYADASGLDAGSVSTARDLLKLAPIAMAEPGFAKIVAESTATIPLNRVKTYNTLLGHDGVIGIKTGSTAAAGGCLLFAAHRTVSGHTYVIYGAVLGTTGTSGTILPRVLAASRRLIVATGDHLHKTTLIPAGTTVASMTTSTGTAAEYTVAKDVTVTGWPGLGYTLSLPAGLTAGQAPTTLTLTTHAGTGAGGEKRTIALIRKTSNPTGTRTPTGTSTATTSTGAKAPAIHYPQAGSQKWKFAAGKSAVAGRTGPLLRYRVAVEAGITGESPKDFATQVVNTLGDKRSWTGLGTWRLQRVGAGDPYDFIIYLVTPVTRDRLCGDTAAGEVNRYTSCRNGNSVVLNVARWVHAVPSYGAALSVYRQYMINHETGHRLGHHHELCPGPGHLAPVMEQQTLGLHGCRANAWPTVDGQAYNGPAGAYGDSATGTSADKS